MASWQRLRNKSESVVLSARLQVWRRPGETVEFLVALVQRLMAILLNDCGGKGRAGGRSLLSLASAVQPFNALPM
jgi:hypothetical protein